MASASAAAEEPLSFTVRPLPRGTTLEGAFRVHIASKDLETLKIRPGELCQLVTVEGTTGTGIAWRSTEITTKANTHPAKLTDTFRDAFNLKLGNQVTITKSNAQIYHADKVIITDVSDHDTSDEVRDDTNWSWRCGNILGNVEAIANGIAFEATSRKGLRKRYLIESINSSFRDSNALFYFDDRSELILQDESAGPMPSVRMTSLRITSEGVGGLDSQIDILNERLDLLIGERQGQKMPSNFRENDGILLYGPKGTGKGLIIDRLSRRPWRKTLRITPGVLSGTATRFQATVNALVTEALVQQPSLIIIENLQAIADTNTGHLIEELARIRGTKVLTIASSTSPADVSADLRSSGRFDFELEFPVPDQSARVDILRTIHQSLSDGVTDLESLAQNIGERTHGYVGKDLLTLYKTALRYARARYLESEWPHRNGSHDGDSVTTLVNGNHVRARPSVSTISSAEQAFAERPVHVDILREDFERALLEVRPSVMKEVFLETPKVQWAQIGGSQAVKRQLTKAIEWPLKHRSEMSDLGIEAKKGVLLYGPPGCSKTMTAKAIATSSGLNFLAVKGAELTSMYVGESERAVREIFRKARTAAPSILFFDEIDSIASARDSSGNSGLNVLTTILNEMDGIESLNGVLIVAATNKPEVLDPALLRPGRFDSLVYIGPPNEAARKEILAIRTRRVPLASNVDLDAITRRTEGLSGAEVVAICTQACEKTLERRITLREQGSFLVDEEARKVSMDDFESALAESVRRITPEMIRGYEQWRAGVTE